MKNREIKFRAKSKKYPNIGWIIWNVIINPPIEIIKGTLGQFTGLKDKNGKEIYEGDIILIESEQKIPITDEDEGPVEDYNQIVPIFFENGSFGVKLKSDLFFINDFYSFKNIEEQSGQREFEIIGNIYENPDLLK